jgi:hypothetical protein
MTLTRLLCLAANPTYHAYFFPPLQIIVHDSFQLLDHPSTSTGAEIFIKGPLFQLNSECDT